MLAISIIFLSLLCFGNSQLITSDTKLNCEDIKTILETNDLLNHFYIEKYDKPIVIVDTFNIVSCKDLSVLNKQVEVTHNFVEEISHGYLSHKYLENKNVNYIVVQRVIEKNSKLEITLWQAMDNAVMSLDIKKKRNKIKVKTKSMGIY